MFLWRSDRQPVSRPFSVNSCVFLFPFALLPQCRGDFFASAGILNAMPLTCTIVALPEWVAAQEPSQWLTDSELITLASWCSPKRRAEWLAGRLAAKRLVQESFGCDPHEFSIGRDGDAPCLVGVDLPTISLSLSHSDGCGAATFSDIEQEGTAGIDVQRVRPVHSGLGERVFTPLERQQVPQHFGSEKKTEGMLLLWALKEAAVKARRIAWGRPLLEIEVRLTEPSLAVIQMTGEAPMAAAYEWLDGWWLARAVRAPD